MEYKNLTFEDLYKANNLFKKKKWLIDDKFKGSLYNRFLMMLERLNPREKEFIFSLVENLKIVKVEDYKDLLFEILEKVLKENVEHINGRNIFVMPSLEKEVLDDGDELKTVIKSGSFISYLFKNINISYDEVLSKYKYIVLASLNEISTKRIAQINNTLLIIPDDFIGNAEQVSRLINSLVDKGIKEKNIIVISFYIMERGMEQIKKLGIKGYYKEIVQERFDNTKRGKNSKEMLKLISEKFGIDEKNYLGRDENQALIVLNRTPNNTYYLLHDKGKGENANKFPLVPRN